MPDSPGIDPPPQPVPGFRIVCEKCGCFDVQIQDNMKQGSEITGAWGSIDLYCRVCGNRAPIHDT